MKIIAFILAVVLVACAAGSWLVNLALSAARI